MQTTTDNPVIVDGSAVTMGSYGVHDASPCMQINCGSQVRGSDLTSINAPAAAVAIMAQEQTILASSARK
jgi:hypothetical protein